MDEYLTIHCYLSLIHISLIMSSMMNYSPEQLNLYLMDFEGGTEFKIYESERLPHIKLLALGVLYAEGSRRYLEALSTYTRRDVYKRQAACAVRDAPQANAATAEVERKFLRVIFMVGCLLRCV